MNNFMDLSISREHNFFVDILFKTPIIVTFGKND